MNDKKLQTKRKTKKGMRVLHARLTKRKQRVSASADAAMLDSDVPSVGVGRALTVILALHVIAIGAIYVGTQWKKSDTLASSTPTFVTDAEGVDNIQLSRGLETDFVNVGEDYAGFAKRHGVSVTELRRVNKNVVIHSGMRLLVPSEKLEDLAQLASTGSAGVVSDRPDLRLETTTAATSSAPAQLITPRRNPNQAVAIPRAVVVLEASGEKYVVQPGDSIWRISRKYKVSQEALMELNGMSDPGKLRSGMTLSIPLK